MDWLWGTGWVWFGAFVVVLGSAFGLAHLSQLSTDLVRSAALESAAQHSEMGRILLYRRNSRDDAVGKSAVRKDEAILGAACCRGFNRPCQSHDWQ